MAQMLYSRQSRCKNAGILDTLLKWPLFGQPKELEIYAPVSTVVLLAVYWPSIGRLMVF